MGLPRRSLTILKRWSRSLQTTWSMRTSPSARRVSGNAELRKFFLSEMEGVPDLELKLQGANLQGGHGTIEWIFSGTDKGVYKTERSFLSAALVSSRCAVARSHAISTTTMWLRS